MGKWRKLFALMLTLGLAASFAAACGKKGGGSDSSEQQSSSVVSEEISSEESEEVSSEVSSEEESSTVESSVAERESDEESSEDVHTCITEGEWITNKTGHWLKCDCGKLVEYGSHEGTAADCNSQPVCEICKVPYGTPPGHTYGALSDGEFGKAYYCTCGAYKTNEDLVDFIVEVESNRDPVVLQLSDTQTWSWGDSPETQCYRYVREVVEKTNPDLIILTGDIVYGRFDPNGTLLTSLIDFMETLDTPWAPVFGNHDNESLRGVDWQCQQLEAAENCLFKQGDVTGNGNYTVGIEQDGELLRVFYMMDSNGCGSPMCDDQGVQTLPPLGTNIVKTSAGFGADQITWYTDSINAIHAIDADVKISMAFHIQPSIFHDAFKKYEEYTGETENPSSPILKNPLNLDAMETADETDFGFLGRTTKGPWLSSSFSISKLKELNVDSIFVGHEHCNSVSIVYEGIRFQYGQKSSTYDRYNVLTADGKIVSNQEGTGTPLLGGTVIPVSGEDGSIGTGYICYYGDPFGVKEPDPVVNGLQYGTDFTMWSDEGSSRGSIAAVEYDENTNAYLYQSGTDMNKLYIKTDLLKGKGTVSFDILVEKESSADWEFAVRIKPNQTADVLPGVVSGYVYYSTTASGDQKIALNEWKTVTTDISAFADVCTEFSIVLGGGNNAAYVKNIVIGDVAEGGGSEGDSGSDSSIEQPEEIVVNGLGFSNVQSGLTVTEVHYEGENAYKVTATSQGKVYIDPALVANKTTFTFTTYVAEAPPETTEAFILRLKPDGAFMDITDDQKHTYYQINDSDENECVILGTWQTFTIDISSLGDKCTEFSFIIPAGGTVYFRDITIA